MFRVRKHSGITSIPSDFNVDVPVIEVDKKGTRLQRVINVPISSIEDKIPSPDEYRLSDLLAAGVPLHPVSSNILDSSPSESEVNSFLDKIENDVEPSKE